MPEEADHIKVFRRRRKRSIRMADSASKNSAYFWLLLYGGHWAKHGEYTEMFLASWPLAEISIPISLFIKTNKQTNSVTENQQPPKRTVGSFVACLHPCSGFYRRCFSLKKIGFRIYFPKRETSMLVTNQCMRPSWSKNCSPVALERKSREIWFRGLKGGGRFQGER